MVPPIDVLLFDPESFFERDDATAWGGPIAIVTTLILVGLADVYPGYKSIEQLYGQLQGSSMMASVTAIGGVVGAVLGPILFVLLVAVTAYFIAGQFDGDGWFAETASVVGWGLLPHVFGALVSVAARYLFYFQTEIQPIPAGAQPQQYQEYVSQATMQATDPIMLIVTVVGLITLFWSGYIWVAGVEAIHGVSRRHATIAVAPWIALPLLATVVQYVLELV